jgi:restriction system protein
VAEIFRDHGWNVELTARTRDGGYDVIAIRSSFPTNIKALVQAKRYAPGRVVGVDIVRSLYGVRTLRSVSQVVLATTTTVSADAKREFSRVIPWELDLLERDKILDWCRREKLSLSGSFPLTP